MTNYPCLALLFSMLTTIFSGIQFFDCPLNVFVDVFNFSLNLDVYYVLYKCSYDIKLLLIKKNN